MPTKVDRVPFNEVPKKLAFDKELGPFVMRLLNILWQQRERQGGDVDAIDALLVRLGVAESDINALQDADIAIDGRLDALEAGGAYGSSVEINFGTSPVYDAQFTITDAQITSSSIVLVAPGGAATGRTADDWQWDGASASAVSGNGSATCYVTFSPGPIVGRRKFNYTVI